jgi:hypothetical protein
MKHMIAWDRLRRFLAATLVMPACVCAVSAMRVQPAHGTAFDPPVAQVRSSNHRIQETFAYALRRSPLFRDLVATLNQLDRVVYVEAGRCPHSEERSCLQLMPTPGGKYLLVRIDSRRSDRTVIAQVAHELYHALEIAREPEVVDAESFKNLYERIGQRNCYQQYNGCWETMAAVDFEASVTRQLSASVLSADAR